MTAAHEEFDVPVSEARGELGRLTDQVRADGRVVYLTRNGERIGALVDPAVAARLEYLDDA
ncbi:type II toxin-antitoxin system prevent-host-death family antitoxin [Nonomuraea sp. NPDC059022]|uniref:type II toxin-antitoxin system prevent-host-death family antitoxin n=1 Tax=Nonomuraea sp. NPDC059022 TaxID=3346705 RepID=UPI0036775AF8